MQPKRRFDIFLSHDYTEHQAPYKQTAISHLRAAELFASRFFQDGSWITVKRYDGEPGSDGCFEPSYKGEVIAPPFLVQEITNR